MEKGVDYWREKILLKLLPSWTRWGTKERYPTVEVMTETKQRMVQTINWVCSSCYDECDYDCMVHIESLDLEDASEDDSLTWIDGDAINHGQESPDNV